MATRSAHTAFGEGFERSAVANNQLLRPFVYPQDLNLLKRVKCEHGQQRSRCKECGGNGICEHGRRRSQCKDCGGASICEHGRRRSGCKECGGSRQDAVILEATVVEVDEDAEPDEWIPTVQSHIVVAAGPRGGKRKR